MLAILPEVPRHSPERNVPVGTSPNLSATRTLELIKEFLCSRVTKTHGEVTPGALLTLWVVCTVPSQKKRPQGDILPTKMSPWGRPRRGVLQPTLVIGSNCNFILIYDRTALEWARFRLGCMQICQKWQIPWHSPERNVPRGTSRIFLQPEHLSSPKTKMLSR